MAELATDPKKACQSIKPREIGAGSEGAARNLLATALIALGVTVGLLVWQTSSSFLVIVAGILFASFLDTCARALGSVMPVDRVWRLTLVVMILTMLVVSSSTAALPPARAEKRKQFDRAIDHPIDVVIDLGLEIFGLAFIDRAMQRA